MSSEEVKISRLKTRKMNLLDKARKQEERKGAFHMKVRDPRKEPFKRLRVRENDYEDID
jgi:hypothetical protein